MNSKEIQEAAELVTLSVRVSRETADAFKAVAGRSYRPVAAEMRRLIEERIAEAHAEDRKAA